MKSGYFGIRNIFWISNVYKVKKKRTSVVFQQEYNFNAYE